MASHSVCSSVPAEDDGRQGARPRLRFEGVGRLYGPGTLANLAGSHVCVVGLGGVGSWAVEALARSGVGSLTLMDPDEVCISNTNRQTNALRGTVGRSKAKVLAERVAEINPECRVHVRDVSHSSSMPGSASMPMSPGCEWKRSCSCSGPGPSSAPGPGPLIDLY